MIESLKSYLESNRIQYSLEDDDFVLNIDNLGKMFILKEQEKTIIRDGFQLNLDYEAPEDGAEDDIKFVCFYFGEKWYYCPIEKKKIKNSDDGLRVKFSELKNVGTNTFELESGNFYHLGIHSEYEMMNGSGKFDDWVKKAKFLKQDAIAICDRNTLAGTLALQIACEKKGIKSIIGETVTVAMDYIDGDTEPKTYEVKLYVANKKGWRSILQINRAINVDYNGFIPEQLLLNNSEGLFIVFSKESSIQTNISDLEANFQTILDYREANFEGIYFQIDSVVYDSEQMDLDYLKTIKTYLEEYSGFLEPILINDSYYIDSDQANLKKFLNKAAKRFYVSTSSEYFKSETETIEIFSEYFKSEPLKEIIYKAIANTKVLADACNFTIEIGKHKLPKFKHENCVELFFDLLQQGVETKLKHIRPSQMDKYLSRIETECELIVGSGLIDYFLILWDIIKNTKERGGLVGPGRGSAGGSMVCYLLDIIDVDPIEYDLLFERFLNATRLSGERAKSADSLPDVDVDFEGDDKDNVKRYIEHKYGRNHVCSIGSYTRMKLKTCLKDFSRVKGLDFGYVNRVTTSIPDTVHDAEFEDLFDYASTEPVIYKFIQDNPDIVITTKHALNCAKAGSIHPSAVIIVPDQDEEGNPMDIFDWMPIKKIDGFLVSEWEGKYMERAGFLKEDILAISQLDKFRDIIKLIKANGKEVIELRDIPLDEPEVFEYFQNGWNEDVFQFGTSGLKTYSVKVKPSHIEHLIAMNALFRPGPMESRAHEKFAEFKNNPKAKPTYDFGLREVTESTKGLYVYQEQIMRAVHVLGNLSLVEADEVRTVMKKFDAKKMKTFEDKFIQGAQDNGCSEQEAKEIWKKLNAFSSYGFNKSHATAYSIIAYQSQWFKVNYPLEFWTVALQYADEKVVPSVLNEYKLISSKSKQSKKISIQPPDINKSQLFFSCDVKTNRIYWSLEKIKSVGEKAVEHIIEVRNSGGAFQSFDDFLNRVTKSKVNKRVIIQLILAGAFDELCHLDTQEPCQRFTILSEYCKKIKTDIPAECLKEDGTPNLMNYIWTLIQKNISGFGIIDYQAFMKHKLSDKRYSGQIPKDYISNFKTVDEFHMMDVGGRDGAYTKFRKTQKVTIAGMITFATVKPSQKKGVSGEYGNITLESNSTMVQCMVYDGLVDNFAEVFKEDYKKVNGKLITISGYPKYNSYRQQNVLIVDEDTTLVFLT